MIEEVLPPANLSISVANFDYYDCFRGVFSDKENRISPEDIGKAFFTTSPKWIDTLFSIRNKIASLFGLKVPDRMTRAELSTMILEPPARVGLFDVLFKNDKEIILGEKDKHLDFKVILLQETISEQEPLKYIYCITVVKYNNAFGKVYFFLVKPFHKIIVKRMMSAMINKITSVK